MTVIHYQPTECDESHVMMSDAWLMPVAAGILHVTI